MGFGFSLTRTRRPLRHFGSYFILCPEMFIDTLSTKLEDSVLLFILRTTPLTPPSLRPLVIPISILMCIQHFIKIFHIVEELRLLPYFGLGVASVGENWHLASPKAKSCQNQSRFGLGIALVKKKKWHLAIPLSESCQY